MTTFMIDPALRLGATHLAVADLGRALDFYAGVLGLRSQETGRGVTALGAGGEPLIVLEERRDARPKPPRTTGLYHTALLLPSRGELARTVRRLAEARYPISGASDHAVSEALYLDDPDGNGLEIYADRPRSQWPKAGAEVRMTVDPLDFDGLLAELDDRPWEGLAAGSVIGHVHLHVSDIPAAEAFYCGLLGFEVMQRFGPSALFVSAGGYHHHLGLNTWQGVGAPPPPADALGLRFYEIRLPVPALEAVAARVRAAGLPLEERDGGLFLRDPAQNGLLLAQG